MPTFTQEEVAKHTSEKDCWVIFKGKVYDVSEYLDDHPGGVEIITDLAGMDCTEDFEDTGHSEEAYDMFDEYYIGDLEGSTSDVVAPAPSGDAAAIKTTVTASNNASVEIKYDTGKPKTPNSGNDNGSVMIMAGAAVAVGAAAAFFLLRKKK
ncbi:Cytochrome b5 [Hondaea fermentalgiana]|uniref:Cytochrome b5 n=1 Tax=Hondaea fermentalgiana TaxID=2315210 RepID=A0A2R5GTM6_9STRA|nr:Cytochrome b5 [Hondaea fermentalgiana]|eukprot:GBG33925.1 Cytochrome b5 [Hondaea fermentalgiana]